jgi:hypothetical protein
LTKLLPMLKIKTNDQDVYAHEILAGQNLDHVKDFVWHTLEQTCSQSMLKLFSVETNHNNKYVRVKYEEHTLFDLVFINHRSSIVFDKWMVYVRSVEAKGVSDTDISEYYDFKQAFIDYCNQVVFAYLYDYVYGVSGEDPEFDAEDPMDSINHSQVIH